MGPFPVGKLCGVTQWGRCACANTTAWQALPQKSLQPLMTLKTSRWFCYRFCLLLYKFVATCRPTPERINTRWQRHCSWPQKFDWVLKESCVRVKEKAPDMICCEKHKGKCHSVTKGKKKKKRAEKHHTLIFSQINPFEFFQSWKCTTVNKSWTAELVNRNLLRG